MDMIEEYIVDPITEVIEEFDDDMMLPTLLP